MKKPRFRWSAILSACVTVFGIVSDPHILVLLVAPWPAVIAVAGVVLQAVTKPLSRKPHERDIPPPSLRPYK